MSYQQPPDDRTGAPPGPPPGWYPDPDGLPIVRWWDGVQWGPHTRPLTGTRQEYRPEFPDATPSASEEYGASGQESVGWNRQQSGLQDGTPFSSGSASGAYPASSSGAQAQQPQDPYQPSGGPQQQPYAPAPQPRPHRAPRRPRKSAPRGILVGGAAIIAAGGAALGLWLGGAFSPSAFTAHGGEQVCVDAPDITDGTQVTVTDSSGHVIGTGALAEDDSPAAMAAVKQYDQLQVSLNAFGLSGSSGMSIYKFTVTVPGGEPRYGVSAGQNRGTVWFSESQMRRGPQLTLGC